MKEIKHVGFGVNGFQLRNPFDRDREEMPDMLAALVRAERKLSAYVGICNGDKELTDTVLPMVRAAIANAPKSDAYQRYTHMRACNAEDDLERLRAAGCSCKGTDDYCPCQNT